MGIQHANRNNIGYMGTFIFHPFLYLFVVHHHAFIVPQNNLNVQPNTLGFSMHDSPLSSIPSSMSLI
jgi:hypothetical protein